MMVKFNRWGWRDAYRCPIAYLVLWPLIAHNYALRAAGLAADEWYWADVMAMHWGYGIRA